MRNYCTARIESIQRRGNVIVVRVVAEGIVVRYHKDKFVKETARQFALDAALEDSLIQDPAFGSGARSAYYNRPGRVNGTPVATKVVVETIPQVKTATASYVTPEYQSDMAKMAQKGL